MIIPHLIATHKVELLPELHHLAPPTVGSNSPPAARSPRASNWNLINIPDQHSLIGATYNNKHFRNLDFHRLLDNNSVVSIKPNFTQLQLIEATLEKAKQ
jgi:hypothetical protein